MPRSDLKAASSGSDTAVDGTCSSATSLCLPAHLKLPQAVWAIPSIVFTNMCTSINHLSHQAAIFKADTVNKLPGSVSSGEQGPLASRSGKRNRKYYEDDLSSGSCSR